MSDEAIAFLGLGRMGGPMAARLAAAGFRVHAHDLSPEARIRAREHGCEPAASAADALERGTVLITMLPDERAVDGLAFSEGRLAHRWPSGVMWIEMTSSLPATTRAVAGTVADRGGVLVDAPVSGGVRAATDGSLTIMVAGDPAARERARPILKVLGSHLVVVGDRPGAGDVAKSLNNMLSAINLTAATEAVALAIKEGVDPRILVDAVSTSTGASNAMSVKVGRFALEDRFDTGFTIDQYLKDLRIALTVADQDELAPPLARATRDLWRGLSQEGHGGEDHTRVVPLFLARDGITIPGGQQPDIAVGVSDAAADER